MMMTARITAAIGGVALVAATAGAQVQTPPDTGRAADSTARAADSLMRLVTRRDSAVVPTLDQPRGIDAEVRAATFELMDDRWVPALDRLQWNYTSPGSLGDSVSPVVLSDSVAIAGLRGREDLMFLLAETYYRLGLSEPFRSVAQRLISQTANPRYRGALEVQLLMDAYRRGEFERAIEMARALSVESAPAEIRGLAALVSGLSAYERGDYAAARAAFATAQGIGAPYGDHAQYMDALALLRTDTAQIAPALGMLEQLAQRASGEFGSQVRLTAAHLAYEAERFDDAARLASQVESTSGVAAQALFTRAWASYKADQLEAAAEAFAQFADRYPQLPEQEESRLMAAQALLELERTAEAAMVFESVADSTAVHMESLRARTPQGLAGAARQLVDARAAGLLFLGNPSLGKTVVLQDAEGIDWAVVAGTVPDTTLTLPEPSLPRMVGLDVLTARVDSVLGAAPAREPQPLDAPERVDMPVVTPVVNGNVPRRLFFTQVSAGRTSGDYVRTAQELYEADVAHTLASFRLNEALGAQARRIALLEALRSSLDADEAALTSTLAELDAARDSLASVSEGLDLTAEWVRRMFAAQLQFTRLLASENQRMADSVRTTLGTNLQEEEASALAYESQTAQTYQNLADHVDAALEGALARHPAFALRDSARMRADRIAALIDETRNALASARSAIDGELARLRTEDAERVMALRAALGEAARRREAAESQLVTVVAAELDARASELLATLQRDTEAAQFGVASAAFFQALEASQAAGATEMNSSAAPAPATGARSASGGTPPRQKQ